MECLKCAALLILLFSLQLHGFETSCEIVDAYVSPPQENCNVTVYVQIDYRCNTNNQLFSIKVRDKKGSGSNGIICFITYTGGECAQQSGCTCSNPQRFSVTRHVKVSQQLEWEITAQLKNRTFISKSINLRFNCDKPKNVVTDNTLVNDASQTTSVNAASETVSISVGVSLGLALLIVTAILGVVFRRKSRACSPRAARQSPANAVTFRQVPAGEQQDRGVVDSDDSHHAYIEVIDDSCEPGTSATGKTSPHEVADSESDGYLQPYASPMSRVSGHCYSSLATRRTKPDDYLNPIQPASDSTAAARTTHSDSPYEIV